MFRGIHQLNLDGKGRLAVPTKYRQALQACCEGQLVITVDRDKCLLLYPLGEWEEIENKLIKLPTFNKAARKLQRLLIGHATELEMDSHGRVLIPVPLRQFARLEKQVVLMGQGHRFELWNEPLWNERRDEWLNEEDDEDLPPEFESLSL